MKQPISPLSGPWKPAWNLFAAAALLAFAAGCAAPTKPATPPRFIFFPAAPDQPRIQFLTSFGSEKDVNHGGSAFATFITGQTVTDNPIGKPYGLAMQHGKIYVCDSSHESVAVLDLAQQRMSMLDLQGEATLSEPLNISLDEDGNRYIVDDHRDQVVALDAQNQFKWALGKKGEMKPRDVVVGAKQIYVADIQSHCVRVYDKATRNFRHNLPQGKDATNMNALVLLPTNLALDQKEQLYVGDTGAGRITVFDADGNFVRNLGGLGDDPGNGLLKRPKGVAVDHAGRVYAVDAMYQLVQVFDEKGQYLMWFGYPGDGVGPASMILPAKVIVDYEDVGLFQKYAAPNFQLEHLILVSNQYGPRKVNVYGFGHQK